jgi:hypothetical protein
MVVDSSFDFGRDGLQTITRQLGDSHLRLALSPTIMPSAEPSRLRGFA